MDIVPEDQVTKEYLENLFTNGGFDVARDKDDDLVVHAESGRVFVIVSVERRRFMFMIQFGIKEEVSLARKLEIVNKLNDDYILCRFTIPEVDNDALRIDYMMTFSKGIVPFHILYQFRRFDEIVSQALREDALELAT